MAKRPSRSRSKQLDQEIKQVLDNPGSSQQPSPIKSYPLPYGWADWAKAERRLQGRYDAPDLGRHGGFVKWAEPPPANPSEERYAVILDGDRFVRWVRVSPNPDVHPKESGGAFYEDMPGGAIEAAVRSARLHKKKISDLVRD